MFELIPFDHHMRTMTSFDPFRAFSDMEKSFFDGGNMVSAFRTDVTDKGDSYVLEAELPGFKKEDIHIDIENDCLTISAEHTQEENEEKHNFVKRERYYGSYSRCFDITGIDVDKIEAAYNDGILSLELPKQAETVPPTRRLEIK